MSTGWRIYDRKGEWVAVDDRHEVSATFTTELAAAYWLLNRRCDELAGTDVLSAYLDTPRMWRASRDERPRVEGQNAVDSPPRDEP